MATWHGVKCILTDQLIWRGGTSGSRTKTTSLEPKASCSFPVASFLKLSPCVDLPSGRLLSIVKYCHHTESRETHRRSKTNKLLPCRPPPKKKTITLISISLCGRLWSIVKYHHQAESSKTYYKVRIQKEPAVESEKGISCQCSKDKSIYSGLILSWQVITHFAMKEKWRNGNGRQSLIASLLEYLTTSLLLSSVHSPHPAF